MDYQDSSEDSQRVCPFAQPPLGAGCSATFTSYRDMLAHCRDKHPDRPRYERPIPDGILCLDHHRDLVPCTDEELEAILQHPDFWGPAHAK